MTISNLRKVNKKLLEFGSYSKSYSFLNTAQKSLKIAINILFFSSAFLFFSYTLITSELLLGGAILCLFGLSFLNVLYLAAIVKQKTLTFPKTISIKKTVENLEKYNKRFSCNSDDSILGKIEKIDFESESCLIVKSDLNGDYISLAKTLKKLKIKQFLNEDFKLKKNVKLFFLSGHIGQSDFSLDTLSLLLTLKLKNPNSVYILKGENENFKFPKLNVISNNIYLSFFKETDKFFKSLPLALLAGEKNNVKTEYCLFSNRSLDLDIDLINPLKNSSTIFINKNKTASLPKRLLKTLPSSLRGKSLDQINDEIEKLKTYLEDKNSKEELKFLNSVIDRKKAQKFLSILNLQNFLIKNKSTIEDFRKIGYSGYFWGKISERFTKFDIQKNSGFEISSDLVTDYFKSISLDNKKIKKLIVDDEYQKNDFKIFKVKSKVKYWENPEFATSKL